MDINVFEKLLNRQLITENEFDKISAFSKNEPISVHWDLRTILYAGILLAVSGLGIIIYENIETIGHDAIITFIGVCLTACFFYCLKKNNGYSNKKVESPNIWFDYILLLGCLLLLTFIAYIQFQYKAFGNQWGLATFVPMVLLFFAAYYFDHLSVLSLAITNFAAWVGITVTPADILSENDFSDERIIFSGLILGAGLIAFSVLSAQRNIKAHFAFTYKNFGAHILLISLLAGMFHFDDWYLVWFLALVACCWLMFSHAIKVSSFYFFVITTLYLYIGMCYVVLDLLFFAGNEAGAFYLALLYFIASGIALIRVLIHYNKKIKSNERIRKGESL